MAGGHDQLVELSDKQLLKLAEIIHLQEVEKLYEIKFDSYEEQQEYLNSCKEARDRMNNLLEAVHSMKAKTEKENDAIKISIAHDIFKYSLKGISTSLQFIRSYSTRITFLDKLSAHSHDLIGLLHRLNPATQMHEAKSLAQTACLYKEQMFKYAKNLHGFVPNQFTRWIKESGITFEDLVRKYMTKLGFGGSFQNLTDIEKLQVYEKIIEAGGRGRSVLTYTHKALGAIGIAVLIFTAATMVWDIYMSENKFEVVLRNSANVLTTVVGAVAGFAAGVIIGIATGALLDLIFKSGTTNVVNATDGLTVCRVAPMPNGLDLARLIKYNYPDL